MKSTSAVRAAVLLAAMMAPPLIAATAAPASSQSATQAADPPERFIPVAYCPRTTQPPTLDGVLDDACWQAAGAIGDFVSDLEDTLPTQ